MLPAPLPNPGLIKKQCKNIGLLQKKNFKMVALPVSCQKILMIYALQSCEVKCVVCLLVFIVKSASMLCLLVCMAFFSPYMLTIKLWQLDFFFKFWHKKVMVGLDSFSKDVH